jgi:hypothetical protein
MSKYGIILAQSHGSVCKVWMCANDKICQVWTCANGKICQAPYEVLIGNCDIGFLHSVMPQSLSRLIMRSDCEMEMILLG